MKPLRTLMAALAVTTMVATASPAQTPGPITQTDIQRLQDEVFQAGSDVQQLRARDAAKAGQLQTQLDDLREEVIYLKVKLRKDGTLGRSEYT